MKGKNYLIKENGERFIIRMAPYGTNTIEKWKIDNVNTPYVYGVQFGNEEYFSHLINTYQSNGILLEEVEVEHDDKENIIGIKA